MQGIYFSVSVIVGWVVDDCQPSMLDNGAVYKANSNRSLDLWLDADEGDSQKYIITLGKS